MRKRVVQTLIASFTLGLLIPTTSLAQTAGSPTDFSQYFFNSETNQKADFSEGQREIVNEMLMKAVTRNAEVNAAGCKYAKDLETKRKCYDLRNKPLDIDIEKLKTKSRRR